MKEKLYLLTESELLERDDRMYYCGKHGELGPPLPEPITVPDDKEIKRLIWEEWEGEIKEEDPRQMVFKYMLWMREQILKTKRK